MSQPPVSLIGPNDDFTGVSFKQSASHGLQIIDERCIIMFCSCSFSENLLLEVFNVMFLSPMVLLKRPG